MSQVPLLIVLNQIDRLPSAAATAAALEELEERARLWWGSRISALASEGLQPAIARPPAAASATPPMTTDNASPDPSRSPTALAADSAQDDLRFGSVLAKERVWDVACTSAVTQYVQIRCVNMQSPDIDARSFLSQSGRQRIGAMAERCCRGPQDRASSARNSTFVTACSVYDFPSGRPILTSATLLRPSACRWQLRHAQMVRTASRPQEHLDAMRALCASKLQLRSRSAGNKVLTMARCVSHRGYWTHSRHEYSLARLNTCCPEGDLRLVAAASAGCSRCHGGLLAWAPQHASRGARHPPALARRDATRSARRCQWCI